MLRRRTTLILIVFLCLSLTFSLTASACTNILVGGEATSDGSVMLGSSEDNGGVRNVLAWVVPAKEYEDGEMVELKRGGELPQVSKTNRYIWLQNVGIEWSDTGINEHGVTIGSGWAASSVPEEFAELKDGGIGYMLRHLMLQRATSAREAVEIGAELVEEFGYAHVGRVYNIAGPKETWSFQVAQGTKYAAQRVPDDEVALVPNGFTIHEVDFEDDENFILADDLIEYAIEYNLYDPDEDPEEFDYAAVYGRSNVVSGGYNIARQYAANYLISGEEPEFIENDWFEEDWKLPFSVKPNREIEVSDVTEILDTHFEFDDEVAYDYGYEESMENNHTPHDIGARTVCVDFRDHGRVAQLRDDMPSDIGNVLWIAPHASCSSAFMPWYVGINETPELWRNTPESFHQTDRSFLEYQFEPQEGVLDFHEDTQYHTFGELRYLVDQEYNKKFKDDLTTIEWVQKEWSPLQENVYSQQDDIEAIALEMYSSDEEAAREFLTDYTQMRVLQAQEKAEEIIHEFKKKYMAH